MNSKINDHEFMPIKLKNFFKVKPDIVFIILTILFFILVIWLCTGVSSNVAFLTTPMTVVFGLWLWRFQELLKRRADAAEGMFKAFHVYAIQVCHIHFRILPKLKQLEQKEIEEKVAVLNTEYEKAMKLQAEYLVARESFYRIANIPDNTKTKIENKLQPFFYVVYTVEDIVMDPCKNSINSFNENGDLTGIGYAEKAGEEIRLMVKPFIQLIKF